MPKDNGKEGFTVHAPSDLITVIDRQAAKIRLNRSQWVVEACLEKLGRNYGSSICEILSKKYENKSK